jgi:chromate transporter
MPTLMTHPTPFIDTHTDDPFDDTYTIKADVAITNPVPFDEALKFWLKLGFVSFGGPAGQIALMHSELVEKRRWLSESRFVHALNYCMLLPGPEAQQLATYIGWLMHRTMGGIMAGLLFVLPSLVLLIALSWGYMVYGKVAWLAGVLYGVKPAIVMLVIHAAYRLGSKVLRNAGSWLIAIAAFTAIFVGRVPFPYIVLAAALIGYFGNRHLPKLFNFASVEHAKKATVPSASKSQHSVATPAIFDDNTPTPFHALFSKTRFINVLLIGGALWLLPILCLYFGCGADHTYTQMAWFFTKAALVTFGGAYAVLPYVHQGAVQHYRWLSEAQMIDGLALGESTPGPLIIVVAFVGFLGGYKLSPDPILLPLSTFFSAALAAFIVTWFTFLPSFVFILAGGPLVESARKRLSFTAPLSAISAAVVGVIINLALFFAYTILLKDPISFNVGNAMGFNASNNMPLLFDVINWSAVVIATLAGLALFWRKQSVIRVIFGAGIFGFLATNPNARALALDLYTTLIAPIVAYFF